MVAGVLAVSAIVVGGIFALVLSHTGSSDGAGPPELSANTRAANAHTRLTAYTTRDGCATSPPFSRLVWSSTFNGPAGARPSSVWQEMSGALGRNNGTIQSFTSQASNVALDGHGNLVLTLRKGATTGQDGITEPYSSAYLQTGKITSCAYGSVQARIWMPEGAGLWPAFWMIGDDFARVGWPKSGEIDVIDMNGSRPNDALGAIHGPIAGRHVAYALQVGYHSSRSLLGAWHTWSVSWTPTSITYLVDGHPYGTIWKSELRRGWGWRFDQPFNVVLYLAVTKHYGSSPAAKNLPAKMYVHWVRIYQ